MRSHASEWPISLCHPDLRVPSPVSGVEGGRLGAGGPAGGPQPLPHPLALVSITSFSRGDCKARPATRTSRQAAGWVRVSLASGDPVFTERKAETETAEQGSLPAACFPLCPGHACRPAGWSRPSSVSITREPVSRAGSHAPSGPPEHEPVFTHTRTHVHTHTRTRTPWDPATGTETPRQSAVHPGRPLPQPHTF